MQAILWLTPEGESGRLRILPFSSLRSSLRLFFRSSLAIPDTVAMRCLAGLWGIDVLWGSSVTYKINSIFFSLQIDCVCAGTG